MAKPDDKLVFVVDGNVKSAEQAMRGLDQAIKKVGGSADITQTALSDLQQAANEAAVKAEAAAHRQVEAQARATAAVEEHKAAQAKVADAVEAAAQDRIAAEKKVQAVVDAAMQDQLAEVQALARAQERLNEVRNGTKGDRSKGAVEARRVANEEVKAARAALAAKQEAAAAGIAAARKEAKERAAAGAASVKAAKDEASLKLAASKEAGRAARATAREALVATAEVERRIAAAQKLVDKLERQASPEGQRDQAFKSFRVQRDAAIRERIAEMERLRDAALADASLEANERAQIEAASNAAIARERAKLNAAEIRAMDRLGLRRKQQIEEEIAQVRKAGQDAASVHAKGSAERVRIERATAAQIKRLNDELASATASAFTQRMQAAAQGLQGLGESLTNAGQALAPASLAAGAALGFSVRDAANFEQQVQNVKALYRSASEEQLAALEAMVRERGVNNKSFDAQEIGKAAEILASQDVTLEDVMGGALDAVISAAAGTGADIESAAKLVTQAGNVFGVAAKDLQGVADTASGLLDISKFGVQDLALAMAQGGSVAKTAGLEFEEFAAIIGIMSKSFESGSDAGTSLKTFIQSLTNDTKAAVAARKLLGFDPFDQNGELRDPRELIAALERAKGKLTTEEFIGALTDQFGSDAARAAASLANGGVAGYDAAIAGVQKGDAEASRAIREQGLNAELNALGNAVKELNIAVGESGILAAMTDVVKGVTELVKWVAELNPAILRWATYILMVGAALAPVLIVVGKTVWALGQLGITLTSISAWFSSAGAAFTAFRLWLMGLLPSSAAAMSALTSVIGAIKAVGLAVLAIPGLPYILLGLGAAALIYAFWDQITGVLTSLFDWITEKWNAFWNSIGEKKIFGKKVGDVWDQSVIGSIVNTVTGYEDNAPAFSDGGRVRGPGTSRSDSIWARLSDGENVTNARASRFWGQGFMDAVNNMDPSAVLAPVAVPVRDQAPLAELHPVTLKIGPENFGGFFGTPHAVEQIQRHLTRQSNTRYASPSRSDQ
ncbi:phage tail tape measure protein [Ruixingdingia sedimenti]|uniref:Phage tail tape measure protein n=1 Tax=Ruixingdingia sedimenti TaxID=3073604 RepID=A0ABU1FDE1_9RHOB|nr:phage tail tape measure protein [Xinfangfangia sp. LG-4]MDR5654881.1 phage tail tape measure protein [Xinfangfangia sp. LG-4]